MLQFQYTSHVSLPRDGFRILQFAEFSTRICFHVSTKSLGDNVDTSCVIKDDNIGGSQPVRVRRTFEIYEYILFLAAG